MSSTHEWIELAATGVEALAVAIMIFLIVLGSIRWVVASAKRQPAGYKNYRVALGKSLLVGLELLVAADIIQTVAIDPTLMGLALLAGLVVVRTFLGWTVTLEVEGHWPWQRSSESPHESED